MQLFDTTWPQPFTPIPALSGYVTGNLQPLGYTNGGPVSLTAGVPSQVGFIIDQQPRYFRIVWTAGGSVANWTVGARLTTAVRKY